jgi:hypothetical protein
MRPIEAYFWRRLDHVGLDSCRLFELADGWRLEGAAVFFEGEPCHFRYEIVVDAGWRTRHARVEGYAGDRAIEKRIESAGDRRWLVDGRREDALDGCPDVDLGFTPATNQTAIRRLDLAMDQRVEAPAAYLEFPHFRFIALPQIYRRLDATHYAYESSDHGYAATLTVSASGAIVDYPDVFERVEED